ncbi:MAG: oxygen-independent coproporphyrinogen III oxidase [Paracoccaceae bacterium]|nr:oxygen-independent coproporphyrinogen III oxidase [Paracoccaceae bacterium]
MDRFTQLRRLGLFDARVPRYTSYPTANHFNRDIGPAEAASWMAGIVPGSEISLYAHVPFCRRLCWFCACRTQGTSTLGPVETYVATLSQELDNLAKHLPSDITLSRLHWGGGTPSILSPALIDRLRGKVFEVAPLATDAEFSVEIDPNEIDWERLEALAFAGMNRASIGVQDFDSEVQEIIGRIQSFDVTKKAAENLRAVGVDSVNIDILYGLPGQSRARITDSVLKVLSLSPDRIALYGYAHVPWMARRQSLIPADRLPDPTERLRLFETAQRLIEADGYVAVGIDHFAKRDDGLAKAAANGTLRRNFQGYTDDQSSTLIGIGASAISRYPEGYAQNAPATSDYTGQIRAGRLATVRGHAFSGDDRLRADVIEALMCFNRVDAGDLAERRGHDRSAVLALLATIDEAFRPMVFSTSEGLSIRPDALPLARMIARSFDAYAMNEASHSPAI